MYDIVVAMYHDQGHIPLKLLGFVYDQATQAWEAVKRRQYHVEFTNHPTSVDHGTAFDQAGKWSASELSLENAIDYAFVWLKIHKKRKEAVMIIDTLDQLEKYQKLLPNLSQGLEALHQVQKQQLDQRYPFDGGFVFFQKARRNLLKKHNLKHNRLYVDVQVV